MIVSFKHKGLRQLFEKGDISKVNSQYADKLGRILSNLNIAETIEGLNFPGYKLHKLRGDLKDHYSIWVSGNWRIVFKFEEGEVTDIDLVDYH